MKILSTKKTIPYTLFEALGKLLKTKNISVTYKNANAGEGFSVVVGLLVTKVNFFDWAISNTKRKSALNSQITIALNRKHCPINPDQVV